MIHHHFYVMTVCYNNIMIARHCTKNISKISINYAQEFLDLCLLMRFDCLNYDLTAMTNTYLHVIRINEFLPERFIAFTFHM